MSMRVSGETESLHYCCGVMEIGGFELWDDSDWVGWSLAEEIDSACLGNDVGTGLGIAAFVNTPACKAAYEELLKHFTILYQSPIYKNKLSGNDLFLVVYLKKGLSNA